MGQKKKKNLVQHQGEALMKFKRPLKPELKGKKKKDLYLKKMSGKRRPRRKCALLFYRSEIIQSVLLKLQKKNYNNNAETKRGVTHSVNCVK